MSSRVFIVEDHPHLRELLEELIRSTGELELCGSSESAEAALTQLGEARADLVVVDLSLPGMNGFELLKELNKHSPRPLCVMLSGHGSKEYASLARQAGANAYVSKSEITGLVGVLRDVLKGGSYSRDFI